MKISNNALNFLLAQYRAIFKRAYVKGIASAVILTAGLAIGQAQAAAGDDILDADDFASGATVPAAQTITKSSTIELGDAEFANKFASNKTYINNQTIDGANVTIVGDETKTVVVSGTSNITVQNGGSLNLKANKNDGLIFYGGDSGVSGTLTATGEGSAINLNAVTANFGNVTIEKGAAITLGGLYDADAWHIDDSTDISNRSGEWVYYTNVYANYDTANLSDAGGRNNVTDGTVNLNHQSVFGADGTVLITGDSTVNFNGDWRSIENGTGYATAIIRAASDSPSKVQISGSETNGVTSTPVVNVLDGKHGAIFAPNINISDTQINLGVASSLTLDGDWSMISGSSKTALGEDKHDATNLTLTDVTFDNQGTVIIGNATSGGSGTVTGTVKLQDDVKNFAKVTIGDGATNGKLIISEDQILKQKDNKGEAIAAGWFAGSNSEIVLSGDSFDGAVLQLKDTDSDGLDLNKDITFASQDDVDASPATTAGKIYVQKSGTIAGEHFVLKEALSLPTDGKLALEADTFEIGKTDGTIASLSAFGAEAYAAHDRVDLQTSGETHVLTIKKVPKGLRTA